MAEAVVLLSLIVLALDIALKALELVDWFRNKNL